MATFELNADLGEGCPFDEQIMPHITQANIACGAHAGDEATMRTSVELALKFGVSIGAHPGYDDRENFGRIDLGLEHDAVYALVKEQVEKLAAICAQRGAALAHVKPHGALYNRAAKDRNCADAIARAVKDVSSELVLMGPPSSCLIEAGRDQGLKTTGEFFADRNYRGDGSLVPRSEPNACIIDNAVAVERVKTLAKTGTVEAVDGTVLSIDAATICLHGDSPHAMELSKLVYEALK